MKIINQIKYELCRREYSYYVEYVHSNRYKKSKFGDYLCKEVQKFLEEDTGHAYDILCITTPPQHGKSMNITETLPSWYLGKNPYHRVIEISYSTTFAENFCRKNISKINEFGNNIFEINIGDKETASEFELSNGVGGMISRGILSGVTGNPCNLMIIDDPIKNRQEADSRTYRQRIWSEWNDSFKSRLAPGAKIIVIQTRWHTEDLTGKIIKNEKNVRVINLKCEASENDPLGRKIGDALAPEIGKDNKWLEDYKASFTTKEGKRSWNALFQGEPSESEGNILKRKWWKYYKIEDTPKMIQRIVSVDATFKDNEDNDFVAIQLWGKRDCNIFLIDAIKERMDFPTTLAAIRTFIAKHKFTGAILVEDKANGSAIIQVLRTEIMGIIPVQPEGGKVSRTNAVSHVIEAGNVYLPEDAPFTEDFIDECTDFPNAEHDDQVDCMAQALNKFIYYAASIPAEKKDIYKEFFGKSEYEEDTYEVDSSYANY